MIVRFVRGEAPLVYSDALHIPDEEFNLLTTEQIEEMKEARYQNWYKLVTRPPEPEVSDG